MKRIVILMLVLMFGFVVSANALLITSEDLNQSDYSIDFSEFSGVFNYTAGPVQVGNPNGHDITWSSSTTGSVIGKGTYYLGVNGYWNSSMGGFVGLATVNPNYMTFTFADAVQSVGGFINHSYNRPPSISALNANGDVLETYVLNISTPHQYNGGEDWGISRTEGDIYGFRLSDSYVVLDDLRYSQANNTAPVPEPATILLMGIGLVGIATISRRKYMINK